MAVLTMTVLWALLPDIKGLHISGDFFDGENKGLKIRHRQVRPELMKKYGIEQRDQRTGKPLYDPPLVLGLGMEDAEVQDRLRSAARDEGLLWISDYLTALKWILPAMVNAWCCCLCGCLDDRLQFQEKLANGEAYKVTCCGPFFTKGEMRVLPVKGHIGKAGELVIVVSSPGDYHPWYPNTDQWGKVHAYFEDMSRKSEGRLIFCPIQKGKKDEYGKELQRPDVKVGSFLPPCAIFQGETL
ncbi:hypothetical protein DUNSADRAFT_12773 [Dunaliella salina]|uniref:Uncharacterized protein n=1 Tax=Dunaliella salina TaxID=3046 RepID=A0ABQ7GAL2_DUNSA|nr:hypothetical protein DUNSADRAFT_12773 [Dunaliella salina]|eukprot:KAF5831645.1 hypothetical protein DUNSADRAFT_12773 [Dunaliella salina]